jgi:DNA-directed RNA polymerase specialized sigma24 family protein
VLWAIDDLTPQEIAQVTGLSAARVREALVEARSALAAVGEV